MFKKMREKSKSEGGFSLVEIAIVMVIIGVIMAAVSIGKDTKDTADATQLFKKRVESCVAVAYGVGDYTEYTEATATTALKGKTLKSFCNVAQNKDGFMVATIYAPNAKDAEGLRDKSFEKLSPDDFTVAAYKKNAKSFTVMAN